MNSPPQAVLFQALVPFLVVSISACGGSSTPSDASDVGEIESGDVFGDVHNTEDVADASDATSPDAANPRAPQCPESEPNVGGTCTQSGVNCEYGPDPRPWCNHVLRCAATGWYAVAEGPDPSSYCQPVQPNDATCPTSVASVSDAGTCSPQSLACVYPAGTCFCAPPPPPASGPPSWRCFPEPGCPVARPRLGDACSTPMQNCTYYPPDGNAQGFGVVLQCIDGAWRVLYSPWMA